MRLPAVAVLGLGVALGACPVDPSDDAGTLEWPDGAFEIGTLVSDVDPTFRPLPTELALQPGAQGGFHAPLLYRVSGETLKGALFEHRARRAKDDVLVSVGSRVFNVQSDGGPWVSEGMVVVFLCPTPVGVRVQDEELNFEVTVSRDGGVVGRAHAHSVVRCPAGSQSFCESICRG
jgi:hypothetical protein